jgi:hypothetical protein
MAVNLSALRAGRASSPRRSSGAHLCKMLSCPRAKVRVEGLGTLKKIQRLITLSTKIILNDKIYRFVTMVKLYNYHILNTIHRPVFSLNVNSTL